MKTVNIENILKAQFVGHKISFMNEDGTITEGVCLNVSLNPSGIAFQLDDGLGQFEEFLNQTALDVTILI
jgi:tRNA A-37 threonylcarbamoyl transferase component Bud32